MGKGRYAAAGGAGAKYAAVLMVALLMAAAFFLPEWLSGLNDRQLLDNPVIETQDEGQEGFAETIQLTVAEKLALLRGGTLTVMELSRETVEGVSANASDSSDAELTALSSGEEDALSQVWEARLAAVRTEIRSLQALGGLPSLWNENSELIYTGFGEKLYVDPDTRMNFQVYHMTLSCEPYDMEVTVDAQSGRILSLNLRWNWKRKRLSWGLQGTSNFGTAWRNYWGMDSVGSGWHNGHNRTILEQMGDQMNINGEYDAHGQISFVYDGQTILIPLDGWTHTGRFNSLSWNI